MSGRPNASGWGSRWRIPAVVAFAAAMLFCVVVALGAGSLLRGNDDLQTVRQWSPFGGEKAQTVGGPDEEEIAKTPENPDEAVLQSQQGLVEVMDEDGQWEIAQVEAVLKAGAHVRTGALSRATLAFYDGSRATLGPQSEIVIDELLAEGGQAGRTIVLSQALGESQHHVASAQSESSRYAVKTSAATAEARGTDFTVTVRPDQLAFIQVTEGKVAVTGAADTGKENEVLVESGKLTVVGLDEGPTNPQYFFTGSGKVSYTGATWVVGGQALITHPGTVIIGSPQVGDEVFFQGRLQADNTRLVDLIVLQQRSETNRFALTGQVEALVSAGTDGFWTVNGQQFAVTGVTQVDRGIVVDDLVEVEGIIMADGTLQAETIRRLQDAPGLPFDFVGIVEAFGDDMWTISDIQVTISETAVIYANPAVGDMVRVTGWIVDGNVWLADRIQLALDPASTFEFTGELQSTGSPWKVANITFETRDWTAIDAGLEIGDQVRVKGNILPDGTRVASEVRLLEDVTEVRIVLVGTVTSMAPDPWVVSEVSLSPDDDTVISPDVAVGSVVRVEIQVLEDGTWKVISITPFGGLDLVEGCQEVTARVLSVDGNQVQLEGYPTLTLGENVEVTGDLQPGSIVLVQICLDENGNPQIVYIYLILQPDVLETTSPEMPGEKVTICHKPNGKNPHTIVVAQPAVPAHLGHGDVLGPCP